MPDGTEVITTVVVDILIGVGVCLLTVGVGGGCKNSSSVPVSRASANRHKITANTRLRVLLNSFQPGKNGRSFCAVLEIWGADASVETLSVSAVSALYLFIT